MQGKWTRAGRGSYELYGLEIGNLLRFSVSFDPTKEASEIAWAVTLNGSHLGHFPTFERAVAAVQYEARNRMLPALEDWERFLTAPEPRRRLSKRR